MTKISHTTPPCHTSLTSPFSCCPYCTPPAAVQVLTGQSLAIAPSVAGCHRMHAGCWPLHLHHCSCQFLTIAYIIAPAKLLTTVIASLSLPVAGHCICIIAPASCWPLHLHHRPCQVADHHYPCQLLAIALASSPLPSCIIIPASCWPLHLQHFHFPLPVAGHCICIIAPASY